MQDFPTVKKKEEIQYIQFQVSLVQCSGKVCGMGDCGDPVWNLEAWGRRVGCVLCQRRVTFIYFKLLIKQMTSLSACSANKLCMDIHWHMNFCGVRQCAADL